MRPIDADALKESLKELNDRFKDSIEVKELTKFCPKCGALMLNHRVDKQ